MDPTAPAIQPEDWAKKHPFLPMSWAPGASNVIKDVNPADAVVQRMAANAKATMPTAIEELNTQQIDWVRNELRRIDSLGTSAGSGFIPPMWLTEVDSTNVIVSSATVNGFTPTNIAANISISSDATWNIYLDATVSATTGAVSAVTITASTSAIPSDTSTHAYRRIGTVVRASGSITTVTPVLAWSQEFVACTPGDTATYHWVVA